MSKILCGDAAEVLKTLPQGSANMCVTSPPYYGLRDYGEENQIGVECTPQEYIERLVEVFAEVYRVLTNDGTLWLNIGDMYANRTWGAVKQKDLMGIPWTLAFALRERGWYLRSDIIWHKTNCLPESVKDRPSKCYEHIFLLSKSSKYYYDYKAIQEPIKEVTAARYKRGRSDNSKYYGKGNDLLQNINRPHDDYSTFDQQYRRKRDVWEVSTNTYKMDEHLAMFPEKLIEPCILAGSKEGDTVLDPFFGSGTTGAVAKRLGREYIGIDLNPRYLEKAEMRIAQVIPEKPYGNASDRVEEQPREVGGFAEKPQAG